VESLNNISVNYDDLLERIQDIFDTSTTEEKEYLIKILTELSESGVSDTYEQVWLADYKEIPVSIDTFIENDLYLGRTNNNGKSVYPFWREQLRGFFNTGNKYYEWVLTGATRIGKSSTAITAVAYMLYRLMCLRNPQRFFNLKDVSKFSILFFNITKDMAKGVMYREFNDTLAMSPWFMSHGKISKSEKNFYYIPEGNMIDIDFGSDAAHGLGKQTFVGIADEMNFAQAGVKDVNKAKSKMRSTYNIITTRVKGTFTMGGIVYGKVFAVSSKRSDSDFMEAYVEEQLEAGAGDHMYITDAPQWDVFPPGRYSGPTFTIAIGDRYQKGFVLNDDQDFPEAIRDLEVQGFTIMRPPIEMKSDFLADFHVALRDLAGIAVVGALSFITQDTLDLCVNQNRRSPFYQDVLQIGTKDNLTIEEFFHIQDVPQECKRAPMFIHLDLAKNTDLAGIGAVAITGRKDVVSEDNKKMSQPTYTHVFSLGIDSPRGDKVPFLKIVAFILWLRRSGFNIAGISADSYQSEYMVQLFEAEGFYVKNISLDRTPDGYIALRAILLEQRIDLLDHKRLQDELVKLQRDANNGKIDHPVGGAKDLSDGLAGSILNAVRENPALPLSGRAASSAIAAANRPTALRSRHLGDVKSSDLSHMFSDLYKNRR